MVVAANNPAVLETGEHGLWWFRSWVSPRIIAGVADRHADTIELARRLRASSTVEAEQVHGAGIAVIGRTQMPEPIAGCDALATEVAGMALLVRTADCLPVMITDPRRGIIGVAHVGWRGLAASLPARLVAALRHSAQSRPDELYVAIGPAIHACCYEVGPEFAGRFGRFVRESQGRLICDLIGVAIEQLVRSGVRPERVTDSGRCTACDPERWFSVRREGGATGRLVSFIMMCS
jgi:YfiH family protein